MVSLAFAQGIDVPGDSDGDKIVSAEELAAAEKLVREGKLSADELEEIKHIHEKYPMDVTDSAGRKIRLFVPAKRIIPFVTWSYEPLYILGLEDRIVGVTSSAKNLYPYLEGISSKPDIGTYKEYDYEKIFEQKPDLVIALPRAVDVLDEKLPGVMVVALSMNNPENIEEELRILADITDSGDRAEEYIAWRQEKLRLLSDVTSKISHSEKRRVYCEYAEWMLHTGGSGSTKDHAIALAGGINIAEDLTMGSNPNMEVSAEWVLGKKPQAILFVNSQDAYYKPVTLVQYNVTSPERAKRFLHDVVQRKEIAGTDAAKNGQMYIIEELCIDSSRGFMAPIYLAKWLYPDQFKDLDPEAIHKEYFERWLGVPYKGIWAYPPAPAS
ncbi:MAG: vitamin B12-transporter protein BtuF [Methanosaeta sp. PtaU1.Bin028]|nr:MAG: vitamin B12-transporter protein BtuF [Methanosaeta sp. PtaU1.Bin028]